MDWKFQMGKKLSKFNESFVKRFDENSNKGYFLEVDVEYPKKFNLHKDFSFLPEREKIEKYEKYVVHIRALKQALNHGLILKRVHRVIQFNQKAWLKPYIEIIN